MRYLSRTATPMPPFQHPEFACTVQMQRLTHLNLSYFCRMLTQVQTNPDGAMSVGLWFKDLA
jgi:hypothetical protein